MKKLLIPLFSVLVLGGCVAKSSVVDENSQRITEILTVIKKHHSDEKALEDIIAKAVATEISGSSMVSKEMMDNAIGVVETQAGRVLGMPVEGVLSGALGLLGIGGAGAVVGRKKRRKQLDALAGMNPDEANKIKDVI